MIWRGFCGVRPIRWQVMLSVLSKNIQSQYGMSWNQMPLSWLLHLLQRGWWAIRSVCEQIGYLMEWTFTVSWFFGTYSSSKLWSPVFMMCILLSRESDSFVQGVNHLVFLWVERALWVLFLPERIPNCTVLGFCYASSSLSLFSPAKLESRKCFAVLLSPNYCKAVYSFWLSPNSCAAVYPLL